MTTQITDDAIDAVARRLWDAGEADYWTNEADHRPFNLNLMVDGDMPCRDLVLLVREVLDAAAEHLTPAPQAEGDVREALAEVILTEHEPGFANVQSSKARDALMAQFREVADAVLRSGLIVPTESVVQMKAENDRLRLENEATDDSIGAARAAIRKANERADAALANVEAAKADALDEVEQEIRDARTGDSTTRATVCAVLRGKARRLRDATPAPSYIPARLLSGEHRGRRLVLSDGWGGVLADVRHHGKVYAGRVDITLDDPTLYLDPISGSHPTSLAPDDLVTLVDGEADQ